MNDSLTMQILEESRQERDTLITAMKDHLAQCSDLKDKDSAAFWLSYLEYTVNGLDLCAHLLRWNHLHRIDAADKIEGFARTLSQAADALKTETGRSGESDK